MKIDKVSVRAAFTESPVQAPGTEVHMQNSLIPEKFKGNKTKMFLTPLGLLVQTKNGKGESVEIIYKGNLTVLLNESA